MALSIYDSRVLTAAVNQMRPVKTPVLDKVFSRKKRQLSSAFMWDIKSSDEQLLGNISVSAPASVTNKTGRKTITCKAPRFAEKRDINAEDLDAVRGFGEEVGPELIKERMADEQFDMRTDIDRTREYQAVKALSGVVVDKDGNTIVDYNLPAAQKPVLTGTALWTDAASDPVKNIRAWKKYIADRMSVTTFTSFCGSGVMDAMLNNANLRDLLKYIKGDQLANQGRIGNLAGVEIEEYFGTYKDEAGTRQQMIANNIFALVGLAPDATAELYAPVADLKAKGGVGKGVKADIFFSKSWETEDPSARWVKVESRPLPVIFRPEFVIYAQVI